VEARPLQTRVLSPAGIRHAARERPKLTASMGVFAATLLAFLGVGAALPVLPRYVDGPLGGGKVAVGLVLSGFAFTAIVCRPLGGRLADALGRRRMAEIGLLLIGVGGALCLVPSGVAGLFVARLVLGVGDGFLQPAAASWIVDLAPEERRGQAIGLLGLAIWGGVAGGPVLGEAALSLGGYDAVWILSAVGPLAGMLLIRRIRDDHRPVRRLERQPWVAPEAVRPGIALAMADFGYAAMAGFAILMLAERGVGHPGAMFGAFAASVVVGRLALGRIPDRAGPRTAAVVATAMQTVGLSLMAVAGAWWTALGAAFVIGLGFSLIYPALALMVVNRVEDARRGAALGSFTAFFDAGVAAGGPLAGVAASLGGYSAAFWMAAAFAAAAGLLALRIGDRSGPAPPTVASSAV
jgi:MFS family permease